MKFLNKSVDNLINENISDLINEMKFGNKKSRDEEYEREECVEEYKRGDCNEEYERESCDEIIIDEEYERESCDEIIIDEEYKKEDENVFNLNENKNTKDGNEDENIIHDKNSKDNKKVDNMRIDNIKVDSINEENSNDTINIDTINTDTIHENISNTINTDTIHTNTNINTINSPQCTHSSSSSCSTCTNLKLKYKFVNEALKDATIKISKLETLLKNEQIHFITNPVDLYTKLFLLYLEYIPLNKKLTFYTLRRNSFFCQCIFLYITR
ncbi:hypothetical protein NAPIS_ORF02776 [Vairimorpha apis BRL 01]|uniref:Uncharacterized protein n=1 Tax=Vairimorpha apis BRL 01 TaxID=1037528 RepID=T0MF03_9MICR|nr:hypothetical protein NAPIS_ORF02776 [Vairimorpha apis BRL 01]